MDNKIDIKEEDPMRDDIASQNEREFLHEVVTVKTSIDAVLVDTHCDMPVKTEIKSETPFIKHRVKQIKSETATSSNSCELERKTEIEQQKLFSDVDSQKEEFVLEDPVIMDKKYNSHQEICNKMEIKEEPLWLETETSSFCDNIKVGDFIPVNSLRLNAERVDHGISDKSILSAEVPERDSSYCNEIDPFEDEYHKYDVTCDVLTANEHVHSDQYGKCGDEADRHIQSLNLKDRSLSDISKTKQCGINEGKKPHQCKTCSKSFTQLSYLKTHNLIHEGKKPHICVVCNRSFTQLSHLKTHNLVHEGKKPHQCKVCNKSFTQLSHLKTHNLVHEGKKAYQCTTCMKSFTRLDHLKTHNLLHEGKKPHQCKVCNRSFTQLSHLKTHNLVHEGMKPQQCKVCNKSFTQLSALKRHNLVHEGTKLHQCKVCNRSFTQLSHLKTHNLTHEGKKPYQCKVCDRSFTRLSHLKRHNLLHEGKKTKDII